MKCIELTQGKVAIVDDEDFENIARFRWQCASSKTHSLLYARRSQYMGGGAANCKLKLVQMHNLILPPLPGFVVDHIDGDGLNNRRSNLRYATHSQNRANGGAHINSKTGIRGVCYREGRRLPWSASIICGGGTKKRHLGSFSTAEEAKESYITAAKARWGEFVRTN